MLAPGLLSGTVLATAGGGEAIARTCAGLGARTLVLDAPAGDEAALDAGVAALGVVDVLVCDAATPFAAAGGGIAGLRAGLDAAFAAARAVAAAIWIPGEGGRLVLLAPAPGAGAHARALRAAAENAARTLSVEWARHGIRATALLPGDATAPDEVAQLVAYLASPAGGYFSGCAFAMGAVAGAQASSAQGTSTESSVGESRATT